MSKKPAEPNDKCNETDQETGDVSFNPAELDGSAPNAMPNGPDPFDPSSLRLSPDSNASFGVKKKLLAVPVRKPHNSWFVRVHPDEGYRLQTAVIEMKEDRETYLVAQTLWPELATEALFKPKLLATAINRQGVVFLWELNLPRSDGRADEWSRTALAAMQMAIDGWVRVSANMSLGAYDVLQATGNLSEPDWPQVPFKELLRVAFKDRYIDNPDHPVLRKLHGEI
jgi:hypothetical protein